MRALKTAFAVTLFTVAATISAHAGSLQVAPVSVEMPSSTSNVTLRNSGTLPLKAQVRVFRWSQANGKDILEPATDLVASPPVATVMPGKDFTVRLVRTSQGPVQAEETFRIIVDELPDPASQKPGTIDMAFRYSVPVFVLPPKPGKPALSWSTAVQDGKTVVVAQNTGDRRVRVSELKVTDGQGRKITVANGLAGYVLARSSMSWVTPGTGKTVASGPLLVTANGDQGTINATASANTAR